MHKPWYTRLYVKSPVTKLLIGILSVGGGIILLAVLLFLEPARMQAQANNWEGRGVEKGADLYINNCASCHGIDGQGGAGPALNSRYFFTQRLNDVGFSGSMADYVESTAAAGRPSKVTNQWNQVMPTWSVKYGGPLREDQVENVSRYIMNWESTALQQTMEEDPWIPFEDTPPQSTPEEVYSDGESVPDSPREARPPEELFSSMGCAGCHNLDLPQDEDNRGPVGPNMANLAENAAQRVDGVSAEDYIHKSIVSPNAYVVDSYFENVMTQNFATLMTEEEIQGMVEWLLDTNR